jgi:hypothetical protein
MGWAVASSPPIVLLPRAEPASAEARARAQAAFQTLARAAALTQSALSEELPPVEVELDYDEGCNAAWDGRRLLLFSGRPNECQPASLNPGLILHEFGHRVIDFLLPRGALTQAAHEALADLYAFLLTGFQPRIGEGLYTDRDITWLRDLTDRRRAPEHVRGLYSESMVLSTALAPVLEPLSAHEALLFWVTSLRSLRQAGTGLNGIEAVGAAFARTAPWFIAQPAFSCVLHASLAQNGIAPPGPVPACGPPLAAETPGPAVRTRTLKGLSRPAPIPEGGGEVNARFTLPRAPLQAAFARLTVDHPFPDDLVLTVKRNGRKRDLYRGHEEVPFPERVRIPAEWLQGSGRLELSVRDLREGLSGVALSLDLEMAVPPSRLQ